MEKQTGRRVASNRESIIREPDSRSKISCFLLEIRPFLVCTFQYIVKKGRDTTFPIHYHFYNPYNLSIKKIPDKSKREIYKKFHPILVTHFNARQ